jgi:UDP-glucose 4-epimerase
MGDGSAEIDPRISRHVSADEAIAHLHGAVGNGLIPMTGRVKIDNYIWGVPERRYGPDGAAKQWAGRNGRGKLLTVCFCCRCCCTILASGKYLPAEAASSLVRLRGLRIEVDPEACTACGACVKECFMGAISIKGALAVHDEALCKGCGRCASVCPQEAVRMNVADVASALSELMDRIDSRIDYR